METGMQKENPEKKRYYPVFLLLGSAFSALACFGLFYFSASFESSKLAQVESDVEIRVRHPKEMKWVQSRKSPLFEGSLIETLKGTQGKIWGADFKADLEPGTIVKMVKDAHGKVSLETVLKRNLETGEIEFQKSEELGLEPEHAEAKEETNLIIPLEKLEEAEAKQVQLGKELERALNTTISLEYVFANLKFPELREYGYFTDYSPRPSYPPVGAVYKSKRFEAPCVGLVWAPVPIPGTSYIVEVSKVRDFAFSRSYGIKRNYIGIRLRQSSDYFWRVKAMNQRESIQGSISRFTLYRPPQQEPNTQAEMKKKRIRELAASLIELEQCDLSQEPL